MAILTQFKVQLAGKENVTDLSYSNSFTLEEKLEKTITINNEEITLDISFIDNIRELIFKSSGVFNVIFTKDTNVITMEIDGVLAGRFTKEFLIGLDSIKLSETNATDVTVEVRAYGEVLPTI